MSWSSLPYSHIPLIIIAWSSIIIHFLVLIVITKYRRKVPSFRNAYITLALAQSIPSIMLLLHVELLVRPREFGLFHMFQPQNNSILAAILLGLQTAQKSQLILFQIPYAANRFTAFIWKPPTSILIILLPLVLPMAFIVIPTQFNISFVAHGDGINLDAPNECIAILSIAAQSCSVLTILICIPLYGIAAFHSHKRFANNSHYHAIHIREERIHLACSIISFGTIILDSARAALLIISTFQQPIDFALYGVVFPYWYHTTELMCCVQPWVMLASNSHLRRNLILVFYISPPHNNIAPQHERSVHTATVADRRSV